MSNTCTSAADLKVDGRLLDASEHSLSSIRTALQRCPATQDALAHAVGAPRMAEIMHTFADNWKDNRKETLWNLGQVLNLVRGTKAAFAAVDRDLAARAKG
ncbi:hypothetical protein G3I60_30745 [Streptomyces sp. SID13666]|uniref:hypothetical protein n=1 Tax=unclassified Streptomyces TaxID=2593676 RepID=UPI0013C04ECE|nr:MULTISPECIES: hypothetical protein [unclassified Streptomyces]NEA58412.1 hypothetical protein [Streptomyces sp. SID13666]NEA73618.1 hypothetical protein [Streptomyces sp. SID13588]